MSTTSGSVASATMGLSTSDSPGSRPGSLTVVLSSKDLMRFISLKVSWMLSCLASLVLLLSAFAEATAGKDIILASSLALGASLCGVTAMMLGRISRAMSRSLFRTPELFASLADRTLTEYSVMVEKKPSSI